MNRKAKASGVSRNSEPRLTPITGVRQSFRSSRLFYELIESVSGFIDWSSDAVYANTAAKVLVPTTVEVLIIFVAKSLIPHAPTLDT